MTKAFEQGPVVIGRQPGCDLVLDFPFISRTHCQIIEERGSFTLVDLNSRNGLKLESAGTGQVPIVDGFGFSIDQLRIEFKIINAAEKSLAASQDQIATLVTPSKASGRSRAIAPAKNSATARTQVSKSAPTPTEDVADAKTTVQPSSDPEGKEKSRSFSISRLLRPKLKPKSTATAGTAPVVATRVSTTEDAGWNVTPSLAREAKLLAAGSAHEQLVSVHPQSGQSGSKFVEAILLWHDQIYEVHEFEPTEKITIGSSRLASIYVPTIPRGWKLAQVDFEKSACYIPKGPDFSLRKDDGQVVSSSNLIQNQTAKARGSGFTISFGHREVLQIDLGSGLQLFLRYVPAPARLTTRKSVEPDFAIKQALVGSAILHIIMAILLIVNSPQPKNVPKIKNVPERFARLLVDPPKQQTEPRPEPTPEPEPVVAATPPPKTPKAEIVKKIPPKPKKIAREKPQPKQKKNELPKQLAQQNQWPLVVKRSPKPAAEVKVPARVKSTQNLREPAPVKQPLPRLPVPWHASNAKIPAALGGRGPAASPSSFSEGVPAGGGRFAASGGAGSAVNTKGKASSKGGDYGTQGLSGKAGSRGFAGAVVGKPQLAGAGEGLTREQVLKAMQKSLPKVQHCYERSLLSNPDLQGRMEFEWEIEPDGHVSAAKVKKSSVNGGGALGDCVKGVLQAIHFPKSKNGQGTTPSIGFPFGRL